MMVEDVFKRLLKAFIGPYIKASSFEGEVTAVDKTKDTCTVQPVEGAELQGVRLRSVVNEDSEKTFVVYPKVGSFVMVSRIHQLDEFFVSAFDEVEEIRIDCDKIIINQGDNSGLVKIDPLVEKVNNLENKVNDLITALQGVTIPLAPSGTYPFAPIFSPITTLTPTIKNDLEDTKVKH
jgi:hypothetical protein